MQDNFWVKIKKNRILYTVEGYYLDDARIIYCQKKLTITRFGANMCARRFVKKKLIQQYIKEIV